MAELATQLLGLPTLPMPFEKGAALVLHRNGQQYAFESYRAPNRDPIKKLG
jgi:hypothetical protein